MQGLKVTDVTNDIFDSKYAAAYYIRGKAYHTKGDSIRSNADFETATQFQLSDE